MSENETNPGGEDRPGPLPYPSEERTLGAGTSEIRPYGDAVAAPDAHPLPSAPAQPVAAQPAPVPPYLPPPPAPSPPPYPAGGPVASAPAPVTEPDLGVAPSLAAITAPMTPPYPARVPSPPPAAPYPAAAGPYQTTQVPPSGPYSWPTGQPVPSGGQPRSVRRGIVAGVAAAAIALAGGAVGGFVGYAMHPDGSPLQISADTGNGNAAPVIDRSSLSSIAAALQPAIVDITTNSGEGSGVVISADGHIVTNNHVIAGARGDSVRVTFNSGRQISAEIVGTDPQTDIAVIKVDAEGLTFAQWGDSESVQVGDTVLAIGSPLGLQGSVTAGIVSALHRTITVGEGQQSQFDTGNTTVIGDAIQTDAPINAGNSGGALVNMRGEVIGINTAIATAGSNGNVGVGFAISANRAKAVSDAIIAGEDVSHPFIGVKIGDHESGGAVINSVVEGSPAAQAGVKTGDIVTKVGDRPIRGAEDLIGAIQSSSVGEQLTLTVRRDGAEQTLTVTVGEQ